jgi:hypothetical protein
MPPDSSTSTSSSPVAATPSVGAGGGPRVEPFWTAYAVVRIHILESEDRAPLINASNCDGCYAVDGAVRR